MPPCPRIKPETQPRSVIAGETAFMAVTGHKPPAKVPRPARIADQSACADALYAAAKFALLGVRRLWRLQHIAQGKQFLE